MENKRLDMPVKVTLSSEHTARAPWPRRGEEVRTPEELALLKDELEVEFCNEDALSQGEVVDEK